MLERMKERRETKDLDVFYHLVHKGKVIIIEEKHKNGKCYERYLKNTCLSSLVDEKQ